MFPAFLGQFRSVFKEDEKPERVEKPPEQQKSSSSEEFLRTPEAKDFVGRWAAKERDGKPLYTKRGVVDLLGALHQVPGLGSDKAIIGAADKILMKLGGMDGLQGFLMGWKAKSEGIVKSLKTVLGGK